MGDLQSARKGLWPYRNGGVSGSTVASSAAAIATILAGLPATNGADAVRVLMNWGANDVSSMPAEATWIADYLTIIDAVVVKWPTAEVLIMKPWRRGFDAECDTLAGWIDQIVAARPGIARHGPDERVWLEDGDDGVTYTSDGIHYNAAGNLRAAQVWTAVLP